MAWSVHKYLLEKMNHYIQVKKFSHLALIAPFVFVVSSDGKARFSLGAETSTIEWLVRNGLIQRDK